MSLLKSTSLTPQRLEANRRNAQHSTGPRSEAGKQCVRMNALKHGCDAAPENEAAVMQALGEDPERLAALKRELATAWGPGDALWDRQMDDLSLLYARRERIERMVTGLMRRALEAVEERRRGLERELAGATFDASQVDAQLPDLPQPSDPCVRLRLLISLWGVVREQVRRREFPLEQQRRVEAWCREAVGWRPRQICRLLGLFANRASFQQKHGQTGLSEYVKETFGGEAQVEARYQELARLLEEEIAATEAAFAEEMAAQERMYAIERDVCLAPEDKSAGMLLRQESALDRSIDRKVRILLTMRKEHERLCRDGSRAAPRLAEGSPPEDEPNEGEGQELRKLVGLDGATESPIAEDAPETPKSPEQSQEVRENKAPATEEVNA